MFKRFVLTLTLIFTLCGCGQYNPVLESKPLKEQATVLQLVYLPDTRSSDISPGISMSGNVVFTVSESGHKEIHGVIFRCAEHKKTFTILSKELFDGLTPSQEVTLEYVELYKIDPETKARIIQDYKTKNVIAPSK